ncbi:rhodanese-like domain-containing protein [Hymenobacter sublimis]|uniref:Rhodanese-like domain-containing protein n=1 Tax=Hymenobacter sublimis TaxID=2933777 RepID=A0ABY4JD86_9BACT|nr:rhodanese-like domain-containing protein [Hymenobacter sublimis]UPL50785.1 rhodanese-like domain-containing protein [Hymenobacter sublimis]
MFRFALLAAGLISSAGAHAQMSVPAAQPHAPAAVPMVNIGTITRPSVPVADLAEVKQALAQPGTVLLDVRTPAEFAAGHLSGAQNVDFRAPDFAQRMALLDPKKRYVLYCASGNRSGKAAVLLQEKGFQKVLNAGGFQALKEGGLPAQ